MAINPMLPLRGAQAVFAIIVLGFTAYVANWWSHYWRDMSPPQFNFLLFSSIWSLLSVSYLVVAPLRFPRMANKFAVLGVDGMTMMFWFGGFVALAVFLSTRVCFGNVCNVAKASVGFAALQWLLFAATTTMAALNVFRPHRAGGSSKHISPPMSNPSV